MDKVHLCTLIVAYNVHFKKYSAGKMNVTQLITSLVWKSMYATYLLQHPGSMFKADNLKERLRDSLKELKTGTSNEENAEKVVIQCNHVMARLRCTKGHAKRNVLWKRHTILTSIVVLQSKLESSDIEPVIDISKSPSHCTLKSIKVDMN